MKTIRCILIGALIALSQTSFAAEEKPAAPKPEATKTAEKPAASSKEKPAPAAKNASSKKKSSGQTSSSKGITLNLCDQ